MSLGDLLARRRAPAAACRSAARTHVGRVRPINEDRTLDRADRGLWAVADGMGGHSGGGFAADCAVGALRRLAETAAPITPAEMIDALAAANRIVHDAARGSSSVSGTTIVALHIDAGVATLVWAGDSRAYLVRGESVEQLTTDHSLVQEMVDAGALTPEEAERHPRANIVTRALGVAAAVELDRRSFPVEPGDVLLLCSDGLSRTLVPSRLPDAVKGNPDEAAAALLADALANDGTDNISVVVIALTVG